MLSTESLLQKLDHYPRIPLASVPTPLEYLPRLSAEYGHPIYIKRDDVMGPALGGNKTRKLEYLMADAQNKRYHKVVTFGGLQSNHARLTAGAAVRLGMEPHLFYFQKRPKELTGNLLINQLLGAKMHFIPLGSGGKAMTIETTIRLVKFIAWSMVGRNYFIPVGGHNWLGCLGYVRAALEIEEQARQLGIEHASLVLAAGSGGTLSALMAGLALTDSKLRLLAVDVGSLWSEFPASIASLACEICSCFGDPHHFTPARVPLIETKYVGERYGVPSAEGLIAIHKLACLEGILLDPVYTAKAFAGMLREMEKSTFGKSDPVIFLHTGGLPALFAFEKYD